MLSYWKSPWGFLIYSRTFSHLGKYHGNSLFITEWSEYFYLFLECSLRVYIYIYVDMSNCFIITCGYLPANYSWLLHTGSLLLLWLLNCYMFINSVTTKNLVCNWEYNRPDPIKTRWSKIIRTYSTSPFLIWIMHL